MDEYCGYAFETSAYFIMEHSLEICGPKMLL
jgi:hypothetical protein